MYPALSILQALNGDVDETLWVGARGGMEAELVRREAIPFEEIPAAGLHGVGLAHLPANVSAMMHGMRESRNILRRFQPDVLLFTGGYVAVPMALANRTAPSLLFVPDVQPGRAARLIARRADTIAVTTEGSKHHYSRSARVAVTGYPVRPSLTQWSREAGLQALSLEADVPVLLVLGGSRGAHSINQALFSALGQLVAEAQIVHITGEAEFDQAHALQEALDASVRSRYHPYAYLHEEMGAALGAASLVVSRAGASTLGEYPSFGLPAILVPYPYAWRYQYTNAQYLASHGAALWVEDGHLVSELAPLILSLLHDAPRREEMGRAMAALATPDSARRLAQLLHELAQGHRRTS